MQSDPLSHFSATARVREEILSGYDVEFLEMDYRDLMQDSFGV